MTNTSYELVAGGRSLPTRRAGPRPLRISPTHPAPRHDDALELGRQDGRRGRVPRRLASVAAVGAVFFPKCLHPWGVEVAILRKALGEGRWGRALGNRGRT